ncbi:hypothetical protein [Paenibacillus contaminans]|uniref:SLH domain-containing protein n=1 Tax=Paenibacillus contaminans TaxID=450362 RepID=A0A329MA72_9BACL|nr:hypothetical protein [Paenibacillus contaminans]RAV16046.1 hypothetical protein DQG23_29065 [Paenibacillus contaminans]
MEGGTQAVDSRVGSRFVPSDTAARAEPTIMMLRALESLESEDKHNEIFGGRPKKGSAKSTSPKL